MVTLMVNGRCSGRECTFPTGHHGAGGQQASHSQVDQSEYQ